MIDVQRNSRERSESEKRSAGGEALYRKYGAEHMRRMGARGVATVQEKYGLRFYSEIARRRRGKTPTRTKSGTP